jgi:hypothetical protein
MTGPDDKLKQLLFGRKTLENKYESMEVWKYESVS